VNWPGDVRHVDDASPVCGFRAERLISPADGGVAFSPDGRTLATSGGNTIRLWTFPPNILIDPAGPVGPVAYSPDGKTLATGSGDNTVWLWNLDVDTAIQRICATMSNILTYTKWKQYLPQLPYQPACARPGHYGLLTP
jgi:hypothetical protein